MRENSGVGEDNPRIPAGYVYLGQFVDHDITFDPISQLSRRNDPEGLINFRTPRFDLDCLYGSGPADEPFQYDRNNPGMFLVDTENGPDLPRNKQEIALIGDKRNDENGIVSQLHVAMLLFHNRRMAELESEFPDPDKRFNEVQRSVQWHYQWVVAHDFLRRIIGDDLHRRLFVTSPDDEGGQRESVRLSFYRHKVNPYMPVEFSGAAYRFGHSQVRDEYSIALLSAAALAANLAIATSPSWWGRDWVNASLLRSPLPGGAARDSAEVRPAMLATLSCPTTVCMVGVYVSMPR